MRWLLLAVAGIMSVYAAGGILVLVRSLIRERQGRRTCTRWLCPGCQKEFGGAFREWRRRKGISFRGGLFNGPVLHCSQCGNDFWFTWDGNHLESDPMNELFEVVSTKP